MSVQMKVAVKPMTKIAEFVHMDKSDVLFQHAQEIETLSKKDAFRAVLKLRKEIGISEFKLGGVLAVIHDKAMAEGGEEWLEGLPDFKTLCVCQFDIQYRKAMWLIGIYKHLVDQKIPWSAVKDMPWTKLRVFASKKAIDSGRAITKKNLEECLMLAYEYTVEELEDQFKKKKGGVSEKALVLTIKHADQKEAIRAALDKARKEVNTKHDAQALFAICQQYLGNAFPTDDQ